MNPDEIATRLASLDFKPKCGIRDAWTLPAVGHLVRASMDDCTEGASWAMRCRICNDVMFFCDRHHQEQAADAHRICLRCGNSGAHGDFAATVRLVP